MKRYVFTLLLAGLVASFPNGAQAKDYVIGLSPYNNRPIAEVQAKKISQFLVENLKPGDSAQIFNAYTMARVASFTVPNKPVYQHPKAVFQFNIKALQSLRQFAAASHAPSGKGQPAVHGAILLPQFLRMTGNSRKSAAPIEILIVGNPLYDEPQSKAFSMANGNVPGTGHLKYAVLHTVYGVDNPKLLKNARVHLSYSGTWARHNQHQYQVHGFWDAFIRRQSGNLVSFGIDLGAVLERIKTNAPAVPIRFALPPSKGLDMFNYPPPVLRKAFIELPVIPGVLPKMATLPQKAPGSAEISVPL
jgi:hypothetical protein